MRITKILRSEKRFISSLENQPHSRNYIESFKKTKEERAQLMTHKFLIKTQLKNIYGKNHGKHLNVPKNTKPKVMHSFAELLEE